MWTQITQAAPLPPCYCHIQMQMGHLMKNTWEESRYGALPEVAIMWATPEATEAATATAFIGNILMMQPEALSSTDNLHNCSHCLNHRDHQQASLDISLWFHHPMIVIVMTSSWWIPHHWPVSVALSPSSHSRLTRNHLLHLWLGTFDLVTL